MKRLLFLGIIVMMALISCEKSHPDNGIPECIESKIKELSTSVLAGKDANVTEYRFQWKRVYLFDPAMCCDMPSPVFDSNCNYLGSLGGFAGNTMINGEDFSKAKFIKIIWHK
ncbi:DUF6970 domain-containing protein [Bacteroides sedimenti]|uniref:DUF6970 domain-containing protein n=1 Tax=Bacteroides sedimenti TaxID=2136147 RepID=A0ABM8ICT8_9BACE